MLVVTAKKQVNSFREVTNKFKLISSNFLLHVCGKGLKVGYVTGTRYEAIICHYTSTVLVINACNWYVVLPGMHGTLIIVHAAVFVGRSCGKITLYSLSPHWPPEPFYKPSSSRGLLYMRGQQWNNYNMQNMTTPPPYPPSGRSFSGCIVCLFSVKRLSFGELKKKPWRGRAAARRLERSNSRGRSGDNSNDSKSPGRRRRRSRWTPEQEEAAREVALDMSVTFLEDALAYRYVPVYAYSYIHWVPESRGGGNQYVTQLSIGCCLFYPVGGSCGLGRKRV